MIISMKWRFFDITPKKRDANQLITICDFYPHKSKQIISKTPLFVRI